MKLWKNKYNRCYWYSLGGRQLCQNFELNGLLALTFDFWPLNGVMSHPCPGLPCFQRPSVLELGSGTGQTDRRTDRQQSSLHNAYALWGWRHNKQRNNTGADASIRRNPVLQSLQWVSGNLDKGFQVAGFKVGDQTVCRLSLFVGLSQFFPSVSLQLSRRLRRLACQLCGHTNASDNDKGVSRNFYWGQDWRAEGRQRGGGSWGGGSNPPPTS